MRHRNLVSSEGCSSASQTSTAVGPTAAARSACSSVSRTISQGSLGAFVTTAAIDRRVVIRGGVTDAADHTLTMNQVGQRIRHHAATALGGSHRSASGSLTEVTHHHTARTTLAAQRAMPRPNAARRQPLTSGLYESAERLGATSGPMNATNVRSEKLIEIGGAIDVS